MLKEQGHIDDKDKILKEQVTEHYETQPEAAKVFIYGVERAAVWRGKVNSDERGVPVHEGQEW